MRALKLLFFLLIPAFASGQYVYVDYKFNRMVRFYEGSMFMEMAAPGTPPANFGHVYAKTDGRLYWKDDAGTEYLLTPGAGAGTVSSFTFTDGSGFDGTVTNPTTTPTLALTTTITDNQIFVSNSGALSGDAGLLWDGTSLTITNLIMNGPTTEYNNIAVSNNGLASSVGTPVNSTGQTAAIAATTAYTADEDGFYQVCWNATITTAATTSSILGPFQVRFTNASDDVVKTFPTSAINFYNQTNANTTGASIGGTMTVYAASGSAIQYIMGYSSGGATAMVFDINLTIIKL